MPGLNCTENGISGRPRPHMCGPYSATTIQNGFILMLILTILLSLPRSPLYTPARPYPSPPPPSARTCTPGRGVSALVWLWAVCVWSKPGLSVGFDAFRLAAILIMQAIACGVVCGFRLRGTLPRKPAPRRLSDCCWPPALE